MSLDAELEIYCIDEDEDQTGDVSVRVVLRIAMRL
jgi:hypothetical protein